MNNLDIRKVILENRFKFYEVAEKIGISDSRFSVWLRTPLNDERKERVLNAINELKKEVS